MAQVVILGAGLTGLGVAYHLEQKGFSDFKIFEKEETAGGLLRSFNQDGFTFDFTGHLLHINNNYFYDFISNIANFNDFDYVTRNTAINIQDQLSDYPIQANLSKLTSKIKIDSIYGFVNRKKNIKNPKNYYEWVLKYFGPGLGKHFFFPYNKKILAYDLKKITASWTGRFIPSTDLKQMLNSALDNKTLSDIGYNSKFYYPQLGGIEYLIRQIIKQLRCNINTNHSAEIIDIKNKRIHFANGHIEKFKYLITTLPLDIFLNQIYEPASLNLSKNSKNLICNSVINFNIGINKNNISKKHWVYYPEKKYPFYRIGFWNNINKNSVPIGHSAIYGETSYLEHNKTKKQIENLTNKSIKSFLKQFDLNESEISTKKILHIPRAYVIYNFWREKNLKKLLKRLKELSIFSIGRYGEWKYSSMQEAIIDSKATSDKLLDLMQHKSYISIKTLTEKQSKLTL